MPTEKFIEGPNIAFSTKKMIRELQELDPAVLEEIITKDEFEKLEKENPLKLIMTVQKGLAKKYENDTSKTGIKQLEQAKKKFAEAQEIAKYKISILKDPANRIPKTNKSLRDLPLPAPKPAKSASTVTATPKAPTPKVDKKELARLEREGRIVKILMLDTTLTRADIEGKNDAELSKLRTDLELKKRGREIHFAHEFLERRAIPQGKITQAEIEALPNGLAVVNKAIELAGKRSIEDIASEFENESPTAKRVERILDKEQIKEINALLDQEDMPIVTHEKRDLDANAAIYILRALGGAKNKNIEEIGKGKSTDRGILIDVGDSHDLTDVTKERWQTNHHHPDKWIKTSSAEIMLETLNQVGRIEKIEPWMREFVSFVTEIDNMSYPRHDKEWFANVYPKTLLGLQESLSIESLVEFFKKGKKPYDALTDEELAQDCVDTEGGNKKVVELVEAVAKDVEKSIQGAEKHESKNTLLGNKTYTNELGKVLVYEPKYRTTKKNKRYEVDGIPLGSHAAYNLGYDSYVRQELIDKNGYFISFPGRDLGPLRKRMAKQDPNALIVRGSMILNYPDENGDDTRNGTWLNEYQFLRYLGLVIESNERLDASIEYQTRRIVRSQNRIGYKTYESKLKATEGLFKKFIVSAQENQAIFEKELEAIKASGKNPAKRIKFLEDKIAGLTQEQKLWEGKVAMIATLRTKGEDQFGTLVDESKFNKKGAGPKEEDDDDDTAAIKALEELVDDDLGVTATATPSVAKVKTAAPKTTSTPSPTVTPTVAPKTETVATKLETKKKREITIAAILESTDGFTKEELEAKTEAELAEIIESEEIEEEVAAAIEKEEAKLAPKPTTTENKAAPEKKTVTEKAPTLANQEKLTALKERYAAIENELAAPAPVNKAEAKARYKELVTEHYNTWNEYQFIKKGSVGEAPKKLTFLELVPILYPELAGKAPAPTPAPTTTVEATKTTESIPDPKGPAQVDKVFIGNLLNGFKKGTERTKFEAAFEKVTTQQEYDKLISTVTEVMKTKENEIIARREAAFDDYYTTEVPQDIKWGIDSEDASGNPTTGSAFIKMGGKDYSVEELKNSSEVKNKDPRALELLGYVQKIQKDVEEINEKYDRELAAL